MVSNLLAFWISKRYQPVSLYRALLRQAGRHLSARMSPAGRNAFRTA
jgi:hypothetical protein